MTQCGAMKGRRRANEWAPVHSSIAGPCYFVLAKDLWCRPVVFRDLKALGLCALVLRICSDCRQCTRLAAAVRLNVHRDLAEQGRWLSPVASCSSPRVGRRTSVRLSAWRPIPKSSVNSCDAGSRRSRTPTGAVSEMLRQISPAVKLTSGVFQVSFPVAPWSFDTA